MAPVEEAEEAPAADLESAPEDVPGKAAGVSEPETAESENVAAAEPEAVEAEAAPAATEAELAAATTAEISIEDEVDELLAEAGITDGPAEAEEKSE